jgi:signal transduction histidine kinase
LAGLAAAIVAVLMGALFVRRLIRPLRNLTAATLQIAGGDLEQRVHIRSHDEFGQLGQAFNTMTEKLARSEKLRRDMIADIAHELRTPLTVIQGDLQAIIEGLYEPTPELLSSIHEESLRLNRLIHDLRELSLAEAGELPLEIRPTDLRELVRSAATTIRPKLEAKGISLLVELPPQPLEAEIDPDRIGQVLANLLSNAERHTPEGGRITLRLSRQDGEAWVSVSDTGPGVAEEDLPYLFERFWRGDKSRARTSGGTGLGLAIAKQLIEAHGGRIWAESQPDEGATFTFSLPTLKGS